jgi:crotonobetainyl-CoA:carnitine CoA-transferase CaiB-like acyl-CoA transferase
MALSDIRVLDLTQVLSGPFCTQMLADLGADVIRAEGPQGDVARSMPPHFVGEDSLYFLSINRNKRSIVVDLKTEDGVALMRRLALASDVVVENFRPGVCERLGLSHEALRAEKPSLIWCSISGFGQTGPYRDKPAYDLVVQALSGGMSLTGERDGVSVRAGIPIADLSAGMYAASAILAALYRRTKTGRGDFIDISMLDCQAAMLCYQAAFYLHSGEVPGRQGREHDSIATYGTFVAGDSVEIVIAALTERMWKSLCRVLGCEELTFDARFSSADIRTKSRAELLPILQQRFSSRGADEWIAELDRQGIPAGVVNTIDRVVTDPQILHRKMVVELASVDGRRIRTIDSPMLFEEVPRQSGSYPPAAGEHTKGILKEVLGLPEGEIDRLVASGAIALRSDTAKVQEPSHGF